MLLVWLGLAVHTCGAMSVTCDEIWHWPVGVRNLVEGDFADDRLNPPLARMWAAIPGAIAGVEVAKAESGPLVGERFVAEHSDFWHWYILGRWFNLVWATATAGLIYGTVWRWKGIEAARWGLLSFLCLPDVIAHASLVTPDSSAMACFFATSLASCLWLRDPTWKRALLLGGLLGAMQAVKYTGVVFFPAIGLLTLWQILSAKTPDWRNRPQIVLQMLAGLVVCLVVIAAAYRFQGLFVPLGSYKFQSVDLRTLQNLMGSLKSIPVPVPQDLLLGIDAQRTIMQGDHPTYLNGQWSLLGFRSYFFWAAAYKLPIVVLGLAVVGGWLTVRERELSGIERFAAGLPVLLLLGVASCSSMQLGFRYVMPVLPLLACLCGVAMSRVSGWGRVPRMAAMALVAIGLLSVWRFHPHHLSYFNEFAGGPAGGRHHLLDSNIDWGQDLLRAKAVVDRFPNEPIRMAYFGQVDPRLVGIECETPPAWGFEPGLYLVSVNFVMGRPGTVRDLRDVRAVDLNEFAYFRWMEPTEHVGYSIDLYRVTPESIQRVIEQIERERHQ